MLHTQTSLPSSPVGNPTAFLIATQRRLQWLALLLLWVAIYAASLFSPPLLDDADATHAQAAQTMLRTGDWVTLHVNGIRYLEKPPLPYWMTACSLKLFGSSTFAVHLPLALAILGLAALALFWGTRAFNQRTGFYAALFTLTTAGVFLFTRVFIPDALLSLLLGFVLYACLRALESNAARSGPWAYAAWLALAAAVLTKGLIAIVFVFAALTAYLWLSGELRLWRRLHPVLGVVLFLCVAAPWHILAGLRNTGGVNGHGFFWFYFVNEHVLRFLGRRIPRDYNKLPAALYWTLHLVWLFPWSFFAPVAGLLFWQRRSSPSIFRASIPASFARRTITLLAIFSALVLLFFSLSTNQEYYTFPVYLPLLLFVAASLAFVEEESSQKPSSASLRRLLNACHWALLSVGLLIAAALAFGLWSSRGLPSSTSVGDLLAHRGVGDYTLSMSHFFDLTGASFSALRLPAALACVAFGAGPVIAILLRRRQSHVASTLTVALMSAVFLIAAHIALTRFAPMLSSADFAQDIQRIEATPSGQNSLVMLYGDQALGSSIPFYLGHRVDLVDGRSTSMYFGSTFPDAPPIFLSREQLLAGWGHGRRKLLFVPLEHRADVDALLGGRQILLREEAGKALITDRPL